MDGWNRDTPLFGNMAPFWASLARERTLHVFLYSFFDVCKLLVDGGEREREIEVLWWVWDG